MSSSSILFGSSPPKEIIIKSPADVNTGCATYRVDSKVFCMNRLLLLLSELNCTMVWDSKEKRENLTVADGR